MHSTKQPAELTAGAEWRAHWPVVLAGFVGLSLAALPMQSMAFFMAPVTSEFGWSKTQFALGAAIFGAAVIPASPIAGAIQDWIGPRWVSLMGTSLCALALITLGMTTGTIEVWVAQWSFFGISELLIKPTVWLAIITRVFTKAQGMATAVALAGTAGALTLSPLLCYWLIENVGWRQAYMALGVGWGGIAFVLALLFFHDRGTRSATSGGPKLSKAAALTGITPEDGLSMREVFRSLPLIRITITLVLLTAVSLAVVTHKVDILNELGISRGSAALIAGATGAASVIGSVVTGWLYDRSQSTWIGVSGAATMLVGFALLLVGANNTPLIVASMFLFGYSGGATLQATMYLTGKYCGARNFGKIFGLKASFTTMGVSAGPLLGSTIFDATGSYHSLFLVGIAISVACSLLLFRLGPYPDWAARRLAAN